MKQTTSPLQNLDAQAIKIINKLKPMRIERKIPLSKQLSFTGTEYRAVRLFLIIAFALILIAAMLIMLLGSRHWVANALLKGISVASLVSFVLFMVFMIISTAVRRRTEADPFSETNLKDRLDHEQSCVQQIINLTPTPTEDTLDRASLLIKGQAERYSGYTEVRNEYFRDVKDLLLAGLVIIGISAESAIGEWATFIQAAQWAGAAALLLGIVLGYFSKGKVYRYQFWLSIIDLTKELMEVEKAKNTTSKKP